MICNDDGPLIHLVCLPSEHLTVTVLCMMLLFVKECIPGNKDLGVYSIILVEIKFGGWTPNWHCKNIDEIKFGDLVRDCHRYYYCNIIIVRKKYWWILIWWLPRQTCTEFSGYNIILYGILL